MARWGGRGRIVAFASLSLVLWTGAPTRAEDSCNSDAKRDSALFLVGDAGTPARSLLEPLRQDTARRVDELGSDRTVVAFLGDNIYPDGLPPLSHRDRQSAERRLRAQLVLIDRTGATGYFVPGNHDWGGGDGWARVRRQGEFIRESGISRTEMVPAGGCPGPVVRSLGTQLELLFLDTQWWLEDGPKPTDPDSACAEDSPEEVVEALSLALRRAAPRHAMVLAHHPFVTGGPHGGNFSWSEHLFPLRDADEKLWVPLPLVGSLYPLGRDAGVSNQDLMGSGNRRMVETLASAMEMAPPLIYAAGHDHSLQAIRGDPAIARWFIVSGAGSPLKITRVRVVEGAEFAWARPGWVRVDARVDGSVEATVVAIDYDGEPVTAFSTCLTSPSAPAPREAAGS